MGNRNKQAITVQDGSGRRQFIRRGAAFVAIGGSLVAAPVVYADDCDRNAGSEKNAEAPNSDSDQGAEADPTGCGRREPPKISQAPAAIDNETTVEPTIKVAKIKA